MLCRLWPYMVDARFVRVCLGLVPLLPLPGAVAAVAETLRDSRRVLVQHFLSHPSHPTRGVSPANQPVPEEQPCRPWT